MLQESQRAVDIMRCAAGEQRREARIHVTLPATLTGRDRNVHHTALVRDLNAFGVFFFCSLTPELGDVMNIQLTFPDGHKQTKPLCKGVVVRVEKSVAQAATGIALRFVKPIPVLLDALIASVETSRLAH